MPRSYEDEYARVMEDLRDHESSLVVRRRAPEVDDEKILPLEWTRGASSMRSREAAGVDLRNYIKDSRVDHSSSLRGGGGGGGGGGGAEGGGYWEPRMEMEMEKERKVMLKRLGMRGLRDNVLWADRFIQAVSLLSSMANDDMMHRCLVAWRMSAAQGASDRVWNRGSAFSAWKGEVISMCGAVAGATAMRLGAWERLLRVSMRNWRLARRVRRRAERPLLHLGIQALEQNLAASARTSQGLRARQIRSLSGALHDFHQACLYSSLRRRGVMQATKIFLWAADAALRSRFVAGWRRAAIAGLTTRVLLNRAGIKRLRQVQAKAWRKWSGIVDRAGHLARGRAGASQFVRKRLATVQFCRAKRQSSRVSRRLLTLVCDAWWDAVMDSNDVAFNHLKGKKQDRKLAKAAFRPWASITGKNVVSNQLAGEVVRSSALGANYGLGVECRTRDAKVTCIRRAVEGWSAMLCSKRRGLAFAKWIATYLARETLRLCCRVWRRVAARQRAQQWGVARECLVAWQEQAVCEMRCRSRVMGLALVGWRRFVRSSSGARMVEIRKKLAHVAAVWLEWRGYTREAPLRLMVRRARDNIGLDLAEHIYELRETDVIKRWRSDCESYRQVGCEMLRMARAAARNPKRASSIRMLRAQVRTEYVERVAFFLGSFAKVGQRTLMQAAVAVWAVHVTLWKVRLERAIKLRIRRDLRGCFHFWRLVVHRAAMADCREKVMELHKGITLAISQQRKHQHECSHKDASIASLRQRLSLLVGEVLSEEAGGSRHRARVGFAGRTVGHAIGEAQKLDGLAFLLDRARML